MESSRPAKASSSSQSPTSSGSPAKDSHDNETEGKKALPRKRTKTGCLTCRKRRIKCDEGRPRCNNCIKSKRNCEGYNQRVMFKDPITAFHPYGSMVYPTQPTPSLPVRDQALLEDQKQTSASLQFIAPKPLSQGFSSNTVHQFSHAVPGQEGPVESQLLNFNPTFVDAGPSAASSSSKFTFFPPQTAEAYSQGEWQQQPHEQQARYDQYRSSLDGRNLNDESRIQTLVAPRRPTEEVASHAEAADWDLSDDDTSMAESDDEAMILNRDSKLQRNEFGLIVSRQFDSHHHPGAVEARAFKAFASEDTLTGYQPSFRNSPLLDKHVAAVFWHFVNVTGPSMSLYERHPFDATPFVDRGHAPKSRQHIWTYTFPILALSHQGLLQAILALGSLQIARIKEVPPTTSLRHYHYALLRIAQNIGKPERRAQPSNLAATLLLAYYEVWNSDHEKWSKHLLGARWLLKDVPLRAMTRSAMAIKRDIRQRREAERQQQRHNASNPQTFDPFAETPLFEAFDSHPDGLQDEQGPLYQDWDMIDLPLLSLITGKTLMPEEFGMAGAENDYYGQKAKAFTEKDIEKYEHYCDLYWWYCKMDVYKSMLGGTKLFMDYDLWTQCPPRAPMGRLGAIYGTYDHVMLLLGRLANFTSRDLIRKRRVAKKTGVFGPTGAPPGSFPGMMPAASRVQIPRGFDAPQDHYSSPKSDSLEDDDLDVLTDLAFREWEGIKQAFEAVRAQFGPEYDAMPPELFPAQRTPFGGPPAHYKTYSIAGIWMNFYMGMIALHRSHPNMPPVAMIAAGRAARETNHYAMEIGRIAAGLEDNVPELGEVSTLVGAAFIESAFCLFVAGVQYQQKEQRDWLIQQVHDVSRLTGWQSARQIADGCESAWVNQHKANRGPPYTRSPSIKIERMEPIFGMPRRLDRRILELEETKMGNSDASPGKKIVLAHAEKAYYALGLLGVEQDLEKLDLDAAER